MATLRPSQLQGRRQIHLSVECHQPANPSTGLSLQRIRHGRRGKEIKQKQRRLSNGPRSLQPRAPAPLHCTGRGSVETHNPAALHDGTEWSADGRARRGVLVCIYSNTTITGKARQGRGALGDCSPWAGSMEAQRGRGFKGICRTFTAPFGGVLMFFLVLSRHVPM